MGIFGWFLQPQFYLVACVYMVTRLFVNVSNSYISLYLQHTLVLENIYVAIVPLVMYIAGFIISVILKFLTKRFGFKVAFALSCIIGLGKKFHTTSNQLNPKKAEKSQLTVSKYLFNILKEDACGYGLAVMG